MQRLEFRDLQVEAFVHATESPEKVERALRLFAPSARIDRRALGGHFGQSLVALRARVEDANEIRQTLDRVAAAVGPELARTAGNRVDRDLVLYVRFDKQRAALGEIALDGDALHDVVKLRVRIRAPRLNRPGAVALVQRQFEGRAEGEEE